MTGMEQESTLQGRTIQLPEELTIARSGEFYPQFAKLVEEGGDITLDGSAVTRIDTAFIQLLYQVQQALVETGHRLRWLKTSEAITRSVELLGMNEQLIPADAG